jgi:hypothetical protein
MTFNPSKPFKSRNGEPVLDFKRSVRKIGGRDIAFEGYVMISGARALRFYDEDGSHYYGDKRFDLINTLAGTQTFDVNLDGQKYTLVIVGDMALTQAKKKETELTRIFREALTKSLEAVT